MSNVKFGTMIVKVDDDFVNLYNSTTETNSVVIAKPHNSRSLELITLNVIESDLDKIYHERMQSWENAKIVRVIEPQAHNGDSTIFMYTFEECAHKKVCYHEVECIGTRHNDDDCWFMIYNIPEFGGNVARDEIKEVQGEYLKEMLERTLKQEIYELEYETIDEAYGEAFMCCIVVTKFYTKETK